jgi:hypothetical protein
VTATLAVDETVAYSAPFSTAHVARLQKLRYALRFPLDTAVQVAYLNPDSTDVVTATLTAVFESESFMATSFHNETSTTHLPVSYQTLPNGYGYVQIASFYDNSLLTIQLWERMIQELNEQAIPGLIIDMRQNGGGFGFLADQMGAYFAQEPHILGNTGYFNEELGDFYFDERGQKRFILPQPELRYDGDLVLLVGPACASACEFFSYNLTIADRAQVVGHFPTAGLGGSVTDVAMPAGETVRFTVGRSVNADGEIHIEGRGVVPTLLVPVTEEVLLDSSGKDVLLNTAVLLLDQTTTPPLTTTTPTTTRNGGIINVGDTITDTLEIGTRLSYTLTVTQGQTLDIILTPAPNSDLDPTLRLYEANSGQLLRENDDLTDKTVNAGFAKLEIPLDLTLRVEISGYNDTSGGDFILTITNHE